MITQPSLHARGGIPEGTLDSPLTHFGGRSCLNLDDGEWLLRAHGVLRAHAVTLTLRLWLHGRPCGEECGLLATDIWRRGALRVGLAGNGALVARLGGEEEKLLSPRLPQECWGDVTLSINTREGWWEFTTGTEKSGRVLNLRDGIDLDTLTVGGRRVAGARHPFPGAIASIHVASGAERQGYARGGDQRTHWELRAARPVVPAAVYRLEEPVQALTGRPMPKDSTAGDGGSRGGAGVWIYRADYAQPCTVDPEDATLLPRLEVSDPKCAIYGLRPSWSWETALACGNGSHGALVLGRPRDEVIVLNRAGLFLPLHEPIAPPRMVGHLEELRELLGEGRFAEASRRLLESAAEDGYSKEKRWTDPYIPAGFLCIDRPDPQGACREYVRVLDFSTGVATVSWEDDAGAVSERVFVSRAHDVVVVHLSSARPRDIVLRLCGHSARASLSGPVLSPDVGRVEETGDVDCLVCTFDYRNKWAGGLQGSRTVARITTEGERSWGGGCLNISGSTEVLIVLRTELFHGEAVPDLGDPLAGVPTTLEALLEPHKAEHGSLFRRVDFDLGGTEEDHRLPAESLFEHSKVGAARPALMEKVLAACRYLAICSCGPAYPPTLQGIWGGTWEPSWSGDYTLNGNLQCAIDGLLPGNMPELMLGFFRYVESLRDDFRTNAYRLYGARGFLVPSRTSSHGLLNHFCDIWPMPFWLAGGAWLARYYHEYWLHTGDREFLENRAIPFLREAALFFEDFLGAPEPEGYHFIPSYSPENDPTSTGSQAAIDATMDHAAVRLLLLDLLEECAVTGAHRESWPRWRAMVAALPSYRINGDGALAEWGDPRLDDRYEHRHASHLYELYQGMTPGIQGSESLRVAFAEAIERRMEVRRREDGGIMGFGMVQLGAPAAALGLAETARETVEWLAHNFWIPECLTPTHNPRSVFNTDITGGLVRIVSLMLVDSSPGAIHLLPALPACWRQGKVRGLLCRGGVEIVEMSWDAQKVSVGLKARSARRVEIRLGPIFGSADCVGPGGASGAVCLPGGQLVEFVWLRRAVRQESSEQP